jgi:hypothetical protein
MVYSYMHYAFKGVVSKHWERGQGEMGGSWEMREKRRKLKKRATPLGAFFAFIRARRRG